MSHNVYSYDVVIIILAHSGVSQPKAWEMWYNSAKDDVKKTVTLMVHSPDKYQTDKNSFESKYSINRFNSGSKIIFEETEWCNISIVYETYKAFQKAYEHMKNKNFSMYYLVSGACLPIKPVENLLMREYGSSIYFIDKCSHSQWISLSKRVVRLLLNNSILHDENDLPITMTNIQFFRIFL